MNGDVVSLKDSIERVIARDPAMKHDFYDAFYRHLFALHPKTWPLFFRTPPAMQEKMLADTVVSIIEHVDGAPWLAEKLAAMGRKHVEYRVKPEMYGFLGDALVAALAEIEGENWNASLARSWREAYDAIAAIMLAGADAATGEVMAAE